MAKREKRRGSTPGRPQKKGNQFWDIGKIGRKTGITLEDKGIRDEHGLEPVSHIFSSPVTPQRGNGTLNSSDMNIQDNSTMLTEPSPGAGSGIDVDETLNLRKTPRLPPPRQSTPKHTNIGSPKRMSTGRPISRRSDYELAADGSPARLRTQPPPNRVLDFGAAEGGVRKSIESPSPFKPRHVLRRSVGAGHQNPFAAPSRDAVQKIDTVSEQEENGAEVQFPQQTGDGPLMMDDGEDFYDASEQQQEAEPEAEPVEEGPSVPKRKPGRPRKSGDSINNSQVQHTPPVANMTSGKKRPSSTLEDVSQSQMDESVSGRASKKQKGGLQSKVVVHQDEGSVAVDPELLAYGDEYVAAEEAEEEEPAAEASEARAQSKTKGKVKGKQKAPKERDPNRAMNKTVQINDSPSKLRNTRRDDRSRSLSVGPISNVHLRASTPFEDAAGRASRYGRSLIQPLKYWANEMRIYKHGETAGIVRADEVSPPKRKKPAKKKRKARKTKLDDIEEKESETESTHPDEWEEEHGVISGMVANWDPEAQAGNMEDLVREDLAFASSAIVTRDVANSAFRYAKIMTLPFFGSGLVELPPEGFKRAKNSRKMQMCFFVHEGKVMVEVGAGAEGEETNQFAISKGGVWVVPRGNNYAITNESRTKTARIFFAQGCEVDALAREVQ